MKKSEPRYIERILIDQLEEYILKTVKRKSRREIAHATDKWIELTDNKVHAREKLIERVYTDLKS